MKKFVLYLFILGCFEGEFNLFSHQDLRVH